MILKSLGIEKVGDILQHKVDIFLEFSELNFMHLMRSALGIGQNVHNEVSSQKSVSISRNFQPTEDSQFLIQKLREYAESIEQEL
mmetsp:Transcript_9389/g.1393  ORF Transcript_9389/g.1393 Transcript_9389/m.1393 type:complete len:85 (+) Transcript_9389:283-537(+)